MPNFFDDLADQRVRRVPRGLRKLPVDTIALKGRINRDAAQMERRNRVITTIERQPDKDRQTGADVSGKNADMINRLKFDNDNAWGTVLARIDTLRAARHGTKP